jgi:metallo-beta-lactamase family protein
MELYRDACIIVSSAGMLEGGRIQQHISEHVENPMCTILIAGFCSPGTMGAQLLEGNSMLRIKGNDRHVYARIGQTDVFSAHPDIEGLTSYFNESDNPKLKKVFFVHGEEEAMYDLKDTLSATLQPKIEVPGRGQEWEL